MSSTRVAALCHRLCQFKLSGNTAPKFVPHCPNAWQWHILQGRTFATVAGSQQRFVPRHGKAVDPLVKGGDAAEALQVFSPQQPKQDMEEICEAGDINPLIQSAPRAGKVPQGLESIPFQENITQATPSVRGDDVRANGGTTCQIRPSKQPTAIHPPDSPPPLETVLQMPPPETAEEENAAKPPHLQMPPYVHHFDTYTLVQQVEAGGFTIDQSITAMKAVRGLLALNLDVAQAGLVSKSDVENETYLFRAACSELKTEIQNSRKKNEEIMRRERTLLQHEVDTLNQKLTQELLTLKDDLKGMFDDRKMAVRMEQRAMESKIQELNYQITVKLNSDSKSDVEGLRWLLTRRSVMGILFMAFMVLTSLRYASYKSHEDEMRKTREAGAKPDTAEELPAQGLAEILAAN